MWVEGGHVDGQGVESGGACGWVGGWECVRVRVCVRVCGCSREEERERECVCVCVCDVIQKNVTNAEGIREARVSEGRGYQRGEGIQQCETQRSIQMKTQTR